LRVTYVGELGWELYCPYDFGLRLWDTIWEAGLDHGLSAGGATPWIRSRLEKEKTESGARYRARGESLRGRPRLHVSWTRATSSVGRAVGGARGAAHHPARLPGAGRRPFGGARLRAVRIGGEVSGRISSGGFDMPVGKSIAYAYVPHLASTGTPLEGRDKFGTWVPGPRRRRAAVSTPPAGGSDRDDRGFRRSGEKRADAQLRRLDRALCRRGGQPDQLGSTVQHVSDQAPPQPGGPSERRPNPPASGFSAIGDC